VLRENWSWTLCTPEDVMSQLIVSKCMPALLYGLEACHLNKAGLNSLDFVVNRFFHKLLDLDLVPPILSMTLGNELSPSGTIVGSISRVTPVNTQYVQIFL